MNKEWTGNKNSVAAMLGMKTIWHPEDREPNDFYSTDPKAVRALMERLQVSKDAIIYECACGAGNLSIELESMGYNVLSTDLIDRGYGTPGIDFLQVKSIPDNCIILTNPPYKYTSKFIEHSMDLLTMGGGSSVFAKYQLSIRKSAVPRYLQQGMAGEGVHFFQSCTLLQKRYQFRTRQPRKLCLVYIPEGTCRSTGH